MKSKHKSEETSLQKKMILIVLPVLIIAASFVYYAMASQKTQETSQLDNTRQSLSDISQELAQLNNQMSKQITAIQKSRKTNNTENTLSLIENAQNINSSAYDKATTLVSGLESMSQSLNGAALSGNRTAISDAISTEISLTNEFISYTKLMGNFLGLLTTSVKNDSPSLEQNIQSSLEAINQKVNDINSLNQEFIKKVSDLNQSLKQQ